MDMRALARIFNCNPIVWGRNPMRIPISHSLLKTATFAAVHFTVAFTIAFLLTGSAAIASALALIEPLANTFAYFLHERAWSRVGARQITAPHEPATAAR